MEQKFNTSFIPKKSLQADVDKTSSEKYARRHSSRGPGFFISLMVFIVAVVVSAGLFGYTTIIENTVQKKINTLKEQKNLFTEKNIEILIAEEQMINLVKELLASHVAISELFDEIEDITLKRIQYVGMEYVNEPDMDPTFILSGNAKDYRDVAAQANQYRISPLIYSPVVHELGTEETGLVYFSIESIADTQLVSFTHAINNTQGTFETSPEATIPDVSTSTQGTVDTEPETPGVPEQGEQSQ